MTTTVPIPSSVQRFERVLFSGLIGAGLNPDAFMPKLISSKDIAEKLREADIPKNKLTGPAMAISQLAWSKEHSKRDIVKGFMSTIVVFQEAVVWLADYQNFNDLTFGAIKEFNNVQTPETVAAIFLSHMIKEDPMYPPGIKVTIDDDGNFSVEHQKEQDQ